MFVSVVLNTEYWDYASRTKWYLKNLLHCKENNWILITHDFMGKHFEEFQKEVTDRFFKEFEMKRFSIDEVRDVEQYYLPDELFDNTEKEMGSRTQWLITLTDKGNSKIEEAFRGIFDEILKKHPGEKIDGIFHCLESFEFMRNISKEYSAPLINYSFSAIRMPHGYRQTLYHTNRKGYLYTGKECEKRYRNYLNENNDEIPVFSRKELIAIIGKDRTLPLIPLMDYEPTYEMGICGESFAILPQFFNRNVYTDDDIFYECNKLYKKEEMVIRSHAAQLDMIRVDRSDVHNDPAPFILSCKRLAGVRSQIMLKVLLWNRTAVVMKDTLGFSFLCSRNYTTTDKADLKGLNYYLICYLVPSALMFSDDYWKWRLTNPEESEIYKRHLNFLFDELKIPKEVFKERDAEKRFLQIMKSRGADEELLAVINKEVVPGSVNFDVTTSKIVLPNNELPKSMWRINEYQNGYYKSCFRFKKDKNESIEFYPLDDVAGSCCLEAVKINNVEVPLSSISGYKKGFKYMPKISGHYTIPIRTKDETVVLECKWKHLKTKDFLNQIES